MYSYCQSDSVAPPLADEGARLGSGLARPSVGIFVIVMSRLARAKRAFFSASLRIFHKFLFNGQLAKQEFLRKNNRLIFSWPRNLRCYVDQLTRFSMSFRLLFPHGKEYASLEEWAQ